MGPASPEIKTLAFEREGILLVSDDDKPFVEKGEGVGDCTPVVSGFDDVEGSGVATQATSIGWISRPKVNARIAVCQVPLRPIHRTYPQSALIHRESFGLVLRSWIFTRCCLAGAAPVEVKSSSASLLGRSE